jgi:deoxyribodipyrimidine photolyase-related protein
MVQLFLVLGNQLFSPNLLSKTNVTTKNTIFFMREDQELCRYFRFHKQKIIFFLSAMRHFKQELEKKDFKVHYELMENFQLMSYEESLKKFVAAHNISNCLCYEIEDKFFEDRILKLFQELHIKIEFLPSPMFLSSRQDFQSYLKKSKKPFMKTFYEQQRKKLSILVEKNEPVGGAWSFDAENRKALPKTIHPPSLPIVKQDAITENVVDIVQKIFPDHPGCHKGTWLPVSRKEAQAWLENFLTHRLEQFGPYEDAIPAHSDFVYHSVLSPLMNIGLLTPQEIVGKTLEFAQKKSTPLASLEGFIRQVIGWREFVRGIYQNYSAQQDTLNFWKHTNHLSDVWYGGKSGIPPLDRALQRVWQRGYLHHIERLMVIGSLMVLLEIHPQEAHRWFMEMFVDSSDWVMGPNVYGMALFSDGGLFATKPYICGSNYYRKMGDDKKDMWCDGVDGLYWTFIEKHRDFFSKNPRLSLTVKSLDKISEDRMHILSTASLELKKHLIK